jgi:heme-degrading monooxygenase HmoA
VAAISAWCNLEKYHAAQSAGRKDIFSDYQQRVASVVRDYGS